MGLEYILLLTLIIVVVYFINRIPRRESVFFFNKPGPFYNKPRIHSV